MRRPLLACAAAAAAAAQRLGSLSPGFAPEPWAPLSGVATGPPAPESPDPLVSHVWPGVAPDALSPLEYYLVPAVACGPAPGTPASAFINASSAVGSLATAITVAGNGTLLVDFGVELAAWIEFDSPDLDAASSASVELCISEYTACDYVGNFKRGAPKAYCGAGAAGCTFRLETNPELYEGVRYAFLTLRAAPARPWTITALRAVAQTKVVNYTGSFSAPGDPLVERVWYTGAYTVRATLQQAYMGSILMDRGDRFSWTGDAHPSQATALAAFARTDIVFNNLNRSKADCQGIATYCLYFVLSIADYWEASGDAAGVAYLTPNVQAHLEQAAGTWGDPQGLRFVGWDDRTGSGFANNTTPETQALYRLLAIRAWGSAAGFLNATGSPALAARYAGLAANRTRDMRARGGTPWYGDFGLHASAEAVTAGFLTPAEAAGVAAGDLSDVVKLPSQSQFNQYFILQALALLGQLDRAVECVALVWGSIVQAGATTFWETSHPSARDLWPPGPSPPAAEQSGWVSLAHPWASGATPWLTRWVTGLRPLEPGYARVLVAPHVSHRMRGVAGAVGTPHGVVAVSALPADDDEQPGGGSGGGGGGAAVVTVTLPAGVAGATLRLTAVSVGRLLGLDAPPPTGDALLAAVELLLGGAPPAPGGVRVTAPADAPLLDEAAPGGARASALELELPPGGGGGGGGATTHTVTLRARGAGAARRRAAWAPRGSPFPPPAWPGTFVGSDATTRGSWLGRYGADGYALLGFDAPPADPFCGAQAEGGALQLRCDDPGATIAAVRFAAYGSAPAGACPAYAPGACAAPGAVGVVAAACVGRAACSVPVSNAAFGGDPCPGTPKQLVAVAHCTRGGGSQPGGAGAPPADRVRLPPYVASVTAQTPDATGFCAARFQWTNGTDDGRALQDPDAGPGSPRHLGYVQPCGCPTAPVDVVLTDAAKAANASYVLSAYFVDFAPSAGCGGFDGTARAQEVYLLTGYPRLNPAAPRQALSAFSGGVWLSWRLQGDVRVRISTVTGDMAVLSALAFDPAPAAD
jgi:hypothetical protein